MYLKYI